jgi:hypothetical protein
VTLESRRRHLRVVPSLDDANPDSAGPGIDDVPRIGLLAAPEPFPDYVWEEIEQAAGVWESLRDDGKQLRYDVDAESGRVLVELCDLSGAPLRPVSLVEALGTDDDDSSAA